MVQKYPRTQKISPLGRKLVIFDFWSHLRDFTPLCPPLENAIFPNPTAKLISKCKNLTLVKISWKTGKNCQFWNLGPFGGILPHCAPPKKCNFPKSDRKTHFQMQKSNSGENFIKNGQKLTDIRLNNPLEINLSVPFWYHKFCVFSWRWEPNIDYILSIHENE